MTKKLGHGDRKRERERQMERIWQRERIQSVEGAQIRENDVGYRNKMVNGCGGKRKYLKFNVDRQTPQVPRKHTQDNGCQFERHIRNEGVNMQIIKPNVAEHALSSMIMSLVVGVLHGMTIIP